MEPEFVPRVGIRGETVCYKDITSATVIKLLLLLHYYYIYTIPLSMKQQYDKYELNVDMGEGFGPWKMGPDEEIMPYIDVANIACGYHAGDHSIMHKTVKMCKKYGVRIGAHPGLPDKMGFGRRFMAIPPDEVYDLIIYQVGALKAFCDIEGVEIESLGPHGQLYFYLRTNDEVFEAVCRAARDLNLPITNTRSDVFKPKFTAQGVNQLDKFFADIDWDENGNLAHFSHWTRKTPEQVAERFKRAAIEDKVECWTGKDHVLNFNGKPFSLGVHSDMPNALENVKAARKACDELNKKFGFETKDTPIE